MLHAIAGIIVRLLATVRGIERRMAFSGQFTSRSSRLGSRYGLFFISPGYRGTPNGVAAT